MGQLNNSGVNDELPVPPGWSSRGRIGASLDIVDAEIYTEAGVVQRGALQVRDGRIARIVPMDQWVRPLEPDVAVYDVQGQALAPGFIDVHVHGGGGYDVMDGTQEALDGMSLFHASRGTTALLATTTTTGHEDIVRAIAAAGAACNRESAGADIVGIHLEGPFLNVARCGAQNPAHIREMDLPLLQQYWETAGGHMRLITIAPEHPRAIESIRWLVERRVTVSAGHSDASYAIIKAAAEAGLSHVTHMFNGMRPLHHREPGVAGAALMLDSLAVELICDGHHVHPALVKYVWDTKPASQTLLITDSMSAAGLPDGDYQLGGLPVVKQGETIRLKTADGSEGSLAGSGLTMEEAFRNFIGWTGATLAEALLPLSANPARQAGVDAWKGSLAPGKDADFILLQDGLRVGETWVRGQRVFKA